MANAWSKIFKDKKSNQDTREESRRPVDSDELMAVPEIQKEKEDEASVQNRGNSFGADKGNKKIKVGKIDIPKVESTPYGSGDPGKKGELPYESKNKREGVFERTTLIGIVLDGTYSFSKIYPRVHMVLKLFMSNMKKTRENCKNVRIKYSLTVLHDTVDIVTFANGTNFTESEDEIKNFLDTMWFFGGSASGKEPLNKAINEQLFVLNTANNASDVKHVIKGLLLFTDSLPDDDNLTPSFTSAAPGAYGDYTNYGLRFADFYSYSSDYMPKMRIIDGNGSLTENGRNTGSYHDIHVLIEQKASDIVQYMDKMVNSHLGQLSMHS